ncbi:MAG TPA: hypothetical protein HPP77_07595 [Candidatus Hydrogenedentes bacterium]|nr:hypothetical protein [Candidatus Hydrogenedentota bacterium]HIJ72847.1 hypothetical protein [Candidatus Hydrogenedentota bacterium]
MKHVKAISRRPVKCEDIPIDILLAFVIGVLTSLQQMFEAKELLEQETS